MYKAVFADDEIIVREGIQKRVNWNEKGFELVGVFPNGAQVAQYINSHPEVDLVISDICMPLLDGLELSRFLSEEYPHIFIMLLTGFDEFEYAQEAIQYNVKELLLKPITAKEFEEVLTRIHNKITEFQRKNLEQEEMKHRVLESLPILRERFLHQLISGNISPSSVEEQLKAYGLPAQKTYSVVVLIDLYHTAIDEKATFYSIIETCKRFLSDADFLFLNKDDQIVAILQQDHQEALSRRARRFGRELIELLHERLTLRVTIGIGSLSEKLTNIQESYRESQKTLAHQFMYGKGRVIAPEDLVVEPNMNHEPRKDLAEALVESLKSQPPENSKAILATFFNETFSEKVSLPFAQLQIQLLLGSIVLFLDDVGIPVMRILHLQDDEMVLVQSLKSREEVESWFYQLIDQIHTEVGQRALDPTHQKIKQACKYIEEHYHDKNLNMQKICQELNISSSHFSAQFKLATGKTFIEYLTNVRVQQAAMLLKTTNLCSYEIAGSVGYEDAHYFSLVFKKQTKMNVREYRKMLNGE